LILADIAPTMADMGMQNGPLRVKLKWGQFTTITGWAGLRYLLLTGSRNSPSGMAAPELASEVRHIGNWRMQGATVEHAR